MFQPELYGKCGYFELFLQNWDVPLRGITDRVNCFVNKAL